MSKTINRWFYFEKSFPIFRTRPIIIYTIPTTKFPIAIDRVDSIYVFDLSPSVIDMTSLPAHILKAPPKKNPIISEMTIVNIMFICIVKNKIRHPQIMMHA